jgi:capsular polysaccharide biosynthesis protein
VSSPSRRPSGRRRPGLLAIVTFVLAGALAFGLLGWLVSVVRGPTYSSETLVVVVPPAQEATTNAIPIAAVWSQAAGTDALLGPVAADLGTTLRELSGATTVGTVGDAPLISIAVRTDDAETAATWANTVADALVERAGATPVSGFTLRALTDAVAPADPEATWAVPLTALGIVLGALAGAWWARRRPPPSGS